MLEAQLIWSRHNKFYIASESLASCHLISHDVCHRRNTSACVVTQCNLQRLQQVAAQRVSEPAHALLAGGEVLLQLGAQRARRQRREAPRVC